MIMDENTQKKIKEIKQNFRLMMNGVASKSMRDKGTMYKINWGVSVPQLKEMAKSFGKDYDLSIELWKENIRECKILATMIMPIDRMSPELVDIWMEQTTLQEIAEIASLNLYHKLPFASVKAFEWMAQDKEIPQICAYQILARLFMNGQVPNDSSANEYLDQVFVALQSQYQSVRHAASTSVQRFASLGEKWDKLAKESLKTLKLELF